MLTRREWFGAIAAAANAAPPNHYAPQIAAQFFIWTQQIGRDRKRYTEGIPAALAATARAGYKQVELVSWIFTPQLRDTTLSALKEQDLACPIVYSGGRMHDPAAADDAIARVLDLAATVKPAGATIINLNPDPKPKRERKTGEELSFQARQVNVLAKELSGRGFQLILHHHDPEMADNAREWKRLVENTRVPLCIDTHWAFRGGQDPLTLLDRAQGRIASLHLRNSENGVWSEALGDGDVDYKAIARVLRGQGFAGRLVVELAYEKDTRITRPLEEDLRLSREYVERVFGAKA